MSNVTVTTKPINIDEFTRNVRIENQDTPNNEDVYVVIGDGVFDKIMETISKHLEVQFTNNRIKAEQYPMLYAELMKHALQVCQQIFLQWPIADANKEAEAAKAELYKRQTKGFDDNAKIKVLEQMLSAWGLAFSVAKDNKDLRLPLSFSNNSIDNLITDLLDLSKLGSMPDGSIGFTDEPYDSVTPRTDNNYEGLTPPQETP